MALYNATNGPNWTNNAGWGGPLGTENTWYGVTTDAGNTTVLRINLQRNNLAGILPTELGNLTNLQTLLLNGNQLTGPIPSSLGNLTNLQALYLGATLLTGTIPSSLGNLTNLQVLYLGSPQLTGVIPSSLGNLTNLRGLYLLTSQITGPIPSSLGNLTNLQSLVLNFNTLLTGTIPSSLGNLTNLQTLLLNANQLTGVIPSSLGNLTNLQQLDLSANQLTGVIPSSLGNLTDLGSSKLDLRFNALYASDPALITFLNSKQIGGDWQSYQTVAPSGVSAASAGSTSVTVFWTPISYTSDPGGYQVWFGTTSGGPYTLFGTTSDKSTTSMTVTGLSSGTPYYFVVQSITPPCPNNQNTVLSGYGQEVSAAPRADTFTISGAIEFQGHGLAGVVLAAASGSYTFPATTGSDGTYTIQGLPSATYTVSPSLAGYAFSPVSRSVTVNGANVTGVNFTATTTYCALSCTASVPSTGQVNTSISFQATAIPSTSCSGGTPTYSWNFGDGGASTEQNPTHTYTAANTYDWSVTASMAGASPCVQTGSITVSNAPLPLVTAVAKMGPPFRLVVKGSNLQDGIQVSINGTRWTNVAWKSTTKIVIKGGASLKAAVPKGTPTTFTFGNPDGGTTTVSNWSW
jgi:PKD repeat protein